MLGQLQIYYVIPIAACICFLIFLFYGKSTPLSNISNYFIVATVAILVVIVVELVEPVFASPRLSYPTWQHWALSIAGYILRPGVAYILLLIELRNKPRRKLLTLITAIPLAINALLVIISPFCGVVYYFDANNIFHSGPLRFVTFVVGFTYLALFLFLLETASKDGREWLIAIPIFIMIGLSVYLESERDLLGSLPLACVVAMIFYYVYFYVDHYTKDALTGAYQRSKFYHDIRRNGHRYFIIFDMNGLKRINDGLGHLAGDNALRSFGQTTLSVLPSDALLYRTGGDEFAVLYSHASESDVIDLLKTIEGVTDTQALPYGFSYGYSSYEKAEDFNSAYKDADTMLYKSKDKFWGKYRANNNQNNPNNQSNQNNQQG